MKITKKIRYTVALLQIGTVLLANHIGYVHSFWLMTSLSVLGYATFLAERSD